MGRTGIALLTLLLAAPAQGGVPETQVAGPLSVGFNAVQGLRWVGQNTSAEPSTIDVTCTDQDGALVGGASFADVPPGQSRKLDVTRAAAGVGSRITCLATANHSLATTLSTLGNLFDPIETVPGRRP
jgi:hypothetical protein